MRIQKTCLTAALVGVPALALGQSSLPLTQPAAPGGPSTAGSAPELSVSVVDGEDTNTYMATLEGAEQSFHLLGQLDDGSEGLDPREAQFLGRGMPLAGEGRSRLAFDVSDAWRSQLGPTFVELAALYTTESGQPALTDTVTLSLGTLPCERLSFNHTPDGSMPQAGEVIEEQWSEIGLHVSAENKVMGHPDKAIIFDSSNPPPTDLDLQTPGYGDGNDERLGNLMIVAENDVDKDGDGLVDVPDDESVGGIITMEFDQPIAFCSIQLVDLDDGGNSEIRFYDDTDTLIDTLPLPPGGDNSVQTIVDYVPGVSRMAVDFESSGGIAAFEFLFCPIRVPFDRTTTGVSTPFVAGEVIDDELGAIGMDVSALSNGAHDEAILFDTDNPTGGDMDLGMADEGLVLIIAENMIDLNGDGIVDVPDDEAEGGMIAIDFHFDVRWEMATVLDIDVDEDSWFEAYDERGALLAIVPLVSLGDGSTQDVTPELEGVRRIELHLGGSGALARLHYCPELAQP